MPIPISPDETWEYQLVEDRQPDPQGRRTKKSPVDPAGTVFVLRPLLPRVEAGIGDRFIQWGKGDEGLIVTKAELNLRMCEYLQEGLVGWRNFRTASGKDVPFKTVRVNGRDICDVDANAAYLTSAQRHELANEITLRNAPKVHEAD